MAEEPAPSEARRALTWRPCRTLTADARSAGSARAGATCVRAAPEPDLRHIVVLRRLELAWIAVEFGGYWQLLSLVSGFILGLARAGGGHLCISSSSSAASGRRSGAAVPRTARLRQPDGVRG